MITAPMRVVFSVAARRALASLAILGCLATLTAAAMVGARHLHWNWAAGVLAAAAVVLAVLGIGLMLDALERWVEGPENDGGRVAPRPRAYTRRRDA